MRIDMFEAREIGLIKDDDWALAQDDPGQVGPFDLCLDCYWDLDLRSDVVCPSYDDDDYHCALCGAQLYWADENDTDFLS